MNAVNLGPFLAALLVCAPGAAPSFPLFPEKTPGARTDTVYVLPEVVVTSSRSSLTTGDLPLAVTVLKPADVSFVRGIGLDEALRGVPGVLAQSRSGSQDVRITIRGFGARGAGERSNAGTSRGIRVLLDGLPLTEPDGRTSFDLLNPWSVGSLEVIRSNATTLWGNASGGVINFRTDMDFANPFVRIRTATGGFGFLKTVIDAGFPIDGGSIGLSYGTSGYDGWRDHSRSTQDIFNALAAIQASAQTRFDISLAAAHSTFRIPGALTPSQYSSDPRQAQDDPINYNPTYVQRDEHRDNTLGRLGVRMEHEFDPSNSITLSTFVTPKFLQRSERNTFRDFTRYHVGGAAVYRNLSALSENITNTLHAGGDVELQDGSVLFYNLANGGRGALRTDKRENALAAGLFIEDDLILDNGLGISLGFRYDDIIYTYEDFYESSGTPLLEDRKSFTGFTPKGGLRWEFSPGSMAYLNVGGGFEIPAGNETDPPSTTGEDTLYAINPLLEPSRSLTLEVGTRGGVEWGGGAFLSEVTYDAAAYFIRTHNDIIPYRNGRFYFTAGESERIGLELSGTARTSIGLLLEGSLTLSQNTYRSYVIDSVHYGRPGASADLSGNDMAGVPWDFYHARVRYAHPDVRWAFVEMTIQGVGAYVVDDYNRFTVSPWTAMHVAGGIDGVEPFGHGLALSLTAAVENLLDRRYAASGWINPDVNRAGEAIYLEPGMARNLVVTAGIRWEY
jgi:iron complex outermembrane recepter protein